MQQVSSTVQCVAAVQMDEQVIYIACHFIDDGWNLHKLLLHAIVTKNHHRYPDGPLLGLDVSSSGPIDVDVAEAIPVYLYNRLFMVAYETTDKDIHRALRDNPSFGQRGKQKLFTTYMDNVLHSIARCFHPDEECLDPVYWGMIHLSLTRQGRLELLAELDLHYGWAYDEHWYACYCCLEILCKKGIPPGQNTDEVKLLCKLWEKIYGAIQKISSSIGPSANLCLAELFKLRDVLQSELAQFTSGDDVHDYIVFEDDKDFREVLREASDTLDKAIKDSYLALSLPLALDPRYKLELISFNFKRAYGSEAGEEYVSKVRTMITKLYADYVEEHCRSQQGMAIQVSSSYHPEAETELDRYLKDPLAPHHPQVEGFDILNWWKIHSSEYPMVARMARDALAVPTCSKLSSDQMAQLKSILRGYSNNPMEDPLLL